MDIIQTLVLRDGMSYKEAKEMVKEAKARVATGEDAEEILHEEFGLEPDYIFDLL